MAAADAPKPRAWLFGPIPDLLLGCGVGYLLVAAMVSVSSIDRATLLLWGGLLTAFTGMPHYGATLLRVYENREDRQRYALFAVWASLLIWGLFVWGVYDRFVGSLLLTVYLTWSPWHYTGQNYGLAVMFLRRGGVPLEPPTKRLLYASFLLSYLLAFLTLHCDPNASTGPDVVGFTYSFLPLRLPVPIYANLFLAVLVLYVGALAIAGWRLRRAGAALGPAGMLVFTQALWFSLPAIGLWLTGRTLSGVHVAFLFVWIAIGHSVQYLWITTYYAAGSGGGSARLRYLGKTLLAGAIVWTVPALVFAPGMLGESSYLLGLFMLVASAVNLQHFVLDGAIWKLRDGPVARILLARAKQETDRPEPIGGRRAWQLGRPAFLAIGGACTIIAIGAPLLHGFGWGPATQAGDAVRAERFERWLTWMGREEPAYWNRRAAARLAEGDPEGALALYRRSIALYPNPEAWLGIAGVRHSRNDIEGTLLALRRSIAVSPTPSAWTAIGTLENRRGNTTEAERAFEAALALAPRDAGILQQIGRFYVERGEAERALPVLERAARVDPRLPWIDRDLERARKRL